MYNQKSILILMSLLISAVLISCIQQESKFTETAPNSTPTAVVMKGQAYLFSNFDPDLQHGFTREGLVNPRNTRAFFDFDEGEITVTNSADIYLDVSCGTDCFNDIIDVNGAVSVEVGKIEPGLDGCIKALQEENKIWASVVPGTYSCINTNSGNIVQILIISNKALSQNANITFEYTIWYLNP